MSTVPWKDYQEQTATFFRSIGFEAETDKKIQGARASHDVDVYVTSSVAGFSVQWVIECKHWKTPVCKLHVVGLREIVSDIGADRGIILCEAGFQSGAIEAANLTNLQLTSLKSLKESSKEAVYAIRLTNLYDRVKDCEKRYWDIPKSVRIDYGLRPDITDKFIEYSATSVIELANRLITAAFRGQYPIQLNRTEVWLFPDSPATFHNHETLVGTLEAMLSDLENRLAAVPI